MEAEKNIWFGIGSVALYAHCRQHFLCGWIFYSVRRGLGAMMHVFFAAVGMNLLRGCLVNHGSSPGWEQLSHHYQEVPLCFIIIITIIITSRLLLHTARHRSAVVKENMKTSCHLPGRALKGICRRWREHHVSRLNRDGLTEEGKENSGGDAERLPAQTRHVMSHVEHQPLTLPELAHEPSSAAMSTSAAARAGTASLSNSWASL